MPRFPDARLSIIVIAASLLAAGAFGDMPNFTDAQPVAFVGHDG